ncbi:hypothetical protein Bpfe_010190, partial [Biomphalaria pfeifferi]
VVSSNTMSDTEQRPGSADTMVLILKPREEDYKQVLAQFPGTKNEQQAYRKNREMQMRLNTYLNEVSLKKMRSASIFKTEKRRFLQKCSQRPTTPPSVPSVPPLHHQFPASHHSTISSQRPTTPPSVPSVPPLHHQFPASHHSTISSQRPTHSTISSQRPTHATISSNDGTIKEIKTTEISKKCHQNSRNSKFKKQGC